MKTTFNVGFPKGKMVIVNNAIPKAIAFITEKYPHISLAEVRLNFSTTRNGSRYYHADGSINIRCSDKMFLYRKATCGLTTPPQGLLIGCEINTACAIIHEITHYIQGIEKRKFSEVETTQNEIDYLKQHEPFWYNRLIPSK